MILFGLIASATPSLSLGTPFHFFDRLSLTRGLPAAPEINTILSALFKIDTTQQLDLQYTEDAHSITIQMPCLHAGELHSTSIRMSHIGFVPQMTYSRELYLSSPIPHDENDRYYSLDMEPSLYQAFTQAPTQIHKATRFISRLLITDQLLTFISMPIFLFFCAILMLFGLHDTDVFNFLNTLRASRLFSTLSLIIGIYCIINLFARVAYIEIGNYLRRRALTPLGAGLLQIQASIEQLRQRLGTPSFVSVTAIEFFLRALMAISLTIYGGFNLLSHIKINFGQALVLAIEKIPGAGELLAPHIFGSNPYSSVPMSDDLARILSIGIGVVFTTGVVGLVMRFLSAKPIIQE
jgi:hypothetical protein